MAPFTPGLELSRRFFYEAVRPIVQRATPELKYAAGLIGSGSEVLGFDDEMSTDHHWGPRVMLFVDTDDLADIRTRVVGVLREQLPAEFLGYPTNFGAPNPEDKNTQLLVAVDAGPVNHRIDVFSLREYLLAYLDFDVDTEIEAADWLTFPEQKLRTLLSRNIFHDDADVTGVLDRFAYYPHDIWLYLLACGWNRISQEEHLMGRAGMSGEDIGSALIGSRLVRDIMRLCFLMERTYAPYSKWLGQAFQELKCAGRLSPHLERALRSNTWQERESHLVPAYEAIASLHNDLGITCALPNRCADFFGRPFKVIELTGKFSDAIVQRITDPEVKRIAAKGLIGSLDQFSDSTDLLSHAKWRKTVRGFFAA